MTLTGLALAARLSRRSEYELLAQAVDGVLPMYRDSDGGFYFDQSTLLNLPRRTACAIKGCPHRRTTKGLCSTHDKRRRRGTDLAERIHTEKARHAAYVAPSGREPLPAVERAEQSDTDILERQPDRARRLLKLWSWEDRQAMQLGTPDMWQKVADEALERAWADLATGAYEKRLAPRLAGLPPAKLRPPPVQSTLMVAVSVLAAEELSTAERRAS